MAKTKKKAAAKKKAAVKKRVAGAKKKPAGAKKKPVAAKKKPAGAKKKPAGAKKKPAGAKEKNAAAAKKKPTGTKKQAGAKRAAAKKRPVASSPSARLAEAPRLPASLYARVQAHTPKLLMGGAVRVPVEHLARVARLAWFADASSHPELRLDPPPGGALAPWSAPGPAVVGALEGSSLRVTFAVPEDHGDRDRWALDARPWLGEVGARLREQPEGTALELLAGSLSDLDGPVLRCCGVLRGGAWEVLSTSPPLARARLEEALALSADAESGRGLSVEPSEADELLSWAHDEPHLFGESALSGRDGAVVLERADPSLLAAVARRLFRRRFAEVWPLADE